MPAFMFAHRFLSYTAVVAFIIYSIAAYNCQGYYHPDEHYQLIEFAGLKNGTNSPTQLTWEYASQIRPALQPYICYLVFQQLAVFYITDPYQCAFVLRLLTAILAVLIITKFTKAYMPRENRNKQIAFILLSFFMWFMPYLNTRFSSEIWSGLSFLLAIALLGTNHNHWKNYLAIGVCMGFAFLFRYQMAFMIAGVTAWLIIVKRIRWTLFISLLGGSLLALLLGWVLDYSYYGNITYPYVNYFEVNIIKDVASNFGTEPWYYYVKYIYQSMYPLLGIIILCSLLIAVVKKPLSIFAWIIIPFFLVHSIIPHKEGRFLFPLIYFIPIILLQAYEVLEHQIIKMPRYIRIGLPIPLLFINALALATITFKPAANGRKYLSHYIHRHYNTKCILLRHTYRSNPYNTWMLSENFYMEKCFTAREIVIPRQLLSQQDSDKIELVVMKKSESLDPMMNAALQGNWQPETSSIPGWIQYLQQFYHGQDLEEPLVLYKRKLQL